MLKLALSATALLALSAFAQAEAPRPFCKVNGVPVSGESGYFLLLEMKHEGLPVAVSAMGASLVDTEVLRQEAVRAGLDKTPEAKKAMAARVEAMLAAVCRGRISEETPAATKEELDAAWKWATAHALTQYEVYRISADTLEEARNSRQARQDAKASGKFLASLAKPLWVVDDDEALDPAERELVRKLASQGGTAFSEPYAAKGGRFAFLHCTGRTRKADPLLQRALEDYAYGDPSRSGTVSFPKEFMPALNKRNVLERLRAAAKLPPYPASGGPWPAASREREEAADQRLLAAEARRRGLDKEDWVIAGQTLVQARALAWLHFERQLAAHPITEAELEQAFEQEDGAPVDYRLKACEFSSAALAKEALARLKAGQDAGAPMMEDWGSAKEFMPEVASALRKLARGAWIDEPLAAPARSTYYLFCWTDLRHAPGFDDALSRRRDGLLEQLRWQRYDDLVARARKAARIETLP